jgi:hypothetical protein
MSDMIAKAEVEKMIKDWQSECANHPALHNQANVLLDRLDGLVPLTDVQHIKHMVNRFLAWKLPEDFSPDGGISFKKTFNEHTAHPMTNQPSGTNLFDATQAETMVRHMLDGLPQG